VSPLTAVSLGFAQARMGVARTKAQPVRDVMTTKSARRTGRTKRKPPPSIFSDLLRASTAVGRLAEMAKRAALAGDDVGAADALNEVALLLRLHALSRKHPNQTSDEESISVVVVEDDDDSREALAMTLRMAGYNVVAEMASGRVGLDEIVARRPRVAVVDLGLPEMNGFDIAQRLRDAHADLVLVALTGYADEEFAARARAAGFDEFLTKPAEVRTLDEVIRSHLARSATAR
jgi:CheY-like chemotaxis protein